MIAFLTKALNVLISTYWNVNAYADFEPAAKFEVLISTYWNVNTLCPTDEQRN